jgi:hypothetical protein
MYKLKRDRRTKAVLNIDDSAYNQHVVETKQQRQLFATIKQVDELKQDISSIKDMLKVLLDGMNKNG